MDKKTLQQLIGNNIEELETLLNSFAGIKSHQVEVKLIYSKLQILKDEIEILANLEEVKVEKQTMDKVEDEVLIETIDESKENVEETTISKFTDKEKLIDENIVKIEDNKEKKDNEIDKNENLVSKVIEAKETLHINDLKDKIIIKSSKPKKERVRRRIERVKKDVQRKIEEENEKIIKQAEAMHEGRQDKKKEPEREIEKKESGKRIKKEKAGIVADKFEVTKQSINDIIANSKRAKDIASMLKDKPITDLKKGISINDKIRFIKELFNGKSDNYQNAIDELNNSADLDEALDYLNKNFVWDQDKESFREFLELVYRRFVNQ